MAKRLGKFERKQAKLARMWRASQVSDNLKIPLRDVQTASEIRSPMSTQHLQSKGARGGFSPYGRTVRFEPKQASNPKRFGKTR